MYTDRDLTKTKCQVIIKAPFYGLMLHNLTLQLTDEYPTAAVKDRALYVNPEYMETLDENQRISLIMHEILHYMLLHLIRAEPLADLYPWELINMAGDYLVNYLINEDGYKIHDDWLYNEEYNPQKFTLETLTKHLANEIKKNGNKSGKMKGNGRISNDMQRGGGVYSESEIRAEESRIKQEIITTLKISEKIGKAPALLERVLGRLIAPVIPWESELWDWATALCKADETWRNPARYYLHRDLYLPSKESKGWGTLAVALDTSGSICQEMLDRFASEINGIKEKLNPEKIICIYCDATVQQVDEFEREDEIKLSLIGGGGTDFVPVFDHLEKDSEDIIGLIYMTDMYGNFPERAPDYPVLWASISQVDSAPFGRVMKLPL